MGSSVLAAESFVNIGFMRILLASKYMSWNMNSEPDWTLARSLFLSIRVVAGKPDLYEETYHVSRLCCPRHGCRGGGRKRNVDDHREFPIVIGRRLIPTMETVSVYNRIRVLTAVRQHTSTKDSAARTDEPRNIPVPPSLYVLNADALSKPHALEQLAADLTSYNIDIAIINETHFKTKHTVCPEIYIVLV